MQSAVLLISLQGVCVQRLQTSVCFTHISHPARQQPGNASAQLPAVAGFETKPHTALPLKSPSKAGRQKSFHVPSGFLPRTPGFAPRLLHMRFIADKVSLRQDFRRAFGSPLSVSLHRCSIYTYLRGGQWARYRPSSTERQSDPTTTTITTVR